MTRDEAVKLATAIAKANGHDDAAAWGEKVGQAWDELENPPAASTSDADPGEAA